MASISEVLRECEKTASWYGLKITSLGQKNHLGDTPLHTVCTWGDVDAVKTLVEGGAKVNELGDMDGVPLFNAVIGRNADVVRLLLDNGADVKIANHWGDTPLQYALKINAPPLIIDLLREAGK
ncbi:ankyrin repeat domain-containing protein [Methylocystis parvus]|uniref:Ankyrin repeat domain-containing protein n=1 Tax=Methylocystis parvus TaxID=134 RepID=A0A6B8M675_9HYPH|nr:ankyrin repeat domain-containing protein [Methylocystis parvus]QGM98391.1 ankyrin repeat domain-containing protein [Methylocystis parvus]WBK01278.1 ankyrin repeat domain-containing protein [Methylocystis parvus OBBP]